MPAVNYALTMLEGVVEGLCWGLNQKLASETANTFDLSLLKSLPPLNMTAPRAPTLDADTDLISLWIDGRFVNSADMQSSEPVNTVEPVRTDLGQREQIFIHQSMIDSILFELYGSDRTITPSPALQLQLL